MYQQHIMPSKLEKLHTSTEHNLPTKTFMKKIRKHFNYNCVNSKQSV